MGIFRRKTPRNASGSTLVGDGNGFTKNAMRHRLNFPTGPKHFVQLRRRRTRLFYLLTNLRGSVVPQILPNIIAVALFTTLICYINTRHPIALNMTDAIVPSLSIIVGLLLAFKTNNSYERYYDGRKNLQQCQTYIRNLTRMIWIDVQETPEMMSEIRKEKTRMINLCLAFFVSLKHHLRGEYGIKYADLARILPDNFFQNTQFTIVVGEDERGPKGKTINGSSYPANSSSVSLDVPDTATTTPDASLTPSTRRGMATRLSSFFSTASSRSAHSNEGYHSDSDDEEDDDAVMSLPVEIVLRLSLFLDHAERTGTLTASKAGSMGAMLNGLIEVLGNCERIRDTPMPWAYDVHLLEVVTVYCLALPFTHVARLGWLTIPVVSIIAFVLLGVESIGEAIADPFGYDPSDLPIDEYQIDMEAELRYLRRHIPSSKDSFAAPSQPAAAGPSQQNHHHKP